MFFVHVHTWQRRVGDLFVLRSAFLANRGPLELDWWTGWSWGGCVCVSHITGGTVPWIFQKLEDVSSLSAVCVLWVCKHSSGSCAAVRSIIWNIWPASVWAYQQNTRNKSPLWCSTGLTLYITVLMHLELTLLWLYCSILSSSLSHALYCLFEQ